MANPFDEFDEVEANPFDEFDEASPPAEKPPESQTPMDIFLSNLGRFMGNAWDDTKEVASGLVSPILNPNEMTYAMSQLMYDENGEYSTDGIKKVGSAVVDRAKEIVTDPAGSFYDRPISTMMDVATVAMPTRGLAAVTRPLNEGVSDTLNKAATVLDNADPINLATTGAAAYQSRQGSQERMEEVLKPTLSPTDRRMEPEVRERVIQSALAREIMPTSAGMGKLRAQIDSASRDADRIISESNAAIPVESLVSALRQQAEGIPDSNKNAIRLRASINAAADDLAQRYEGREILGAEELRELRRSGDDVINHNRKYLNGEPVQSQTDKIYADTLREELARAVPELRDPNAELSALYDIADMYQKPTQRLRNNASSGLRQDIIMGGGQGAVGGLMAHLLNVDPVVGVGGGLLLQGARSRSADPLVKMNRAQNAYNAEQNGLIFRNADKYSPYSDGRYTLSLLDALMDEEERD